MVKAKLNPMLDNRRFPNNDREGFNAEYSREWTTEQRKKYKWHGPKRTAMRLLGGREIK